MSEFCPKCGSPITEHGEFCGNCGYRYNSTIIGIGDSSISKKVESSSNKKSDKKMISDSDDGMTITKDTYFNKPDILIGKMVGEYKITDIIGKGGMGWVYSGVHPIIQKKVAVKVLKTKYSEDTDIVNSFINEAKAANAIGSSKIVDIFAFGKLPSGNCYFVMELMNGESLADFIKREGKISNLDAYDIIPQILDALEAAHKRNIIHRDLKPENIHIYRDEKGKINIKLLDFGIAKFKEEGVSLHETQAGVIKGSPLYMSPEQCRGIEITSRADIYSLGVILYKLFTGEEPFQGKSSLEVITAHLRDMPVPPIERTSIPVKLNQIIMDCLEKDKDKRPVDIQEIRERINPVLQEMALGVGDVKPGKKVTPWIVLSIVLILMTIGGIYIYNKPSHRKSLNKSAVTKKIHWQYIDVISAHPDIVNSEFGAGFTRWIKKTMDLDVKVKWHPMRDNIDPMKRKLAMDIKNGENSNFDVIFGGGEQLHRRLSSKMCIKVKKTGYRCTARYSPPEDVFKQLTHKLNGIELFDSHGYWFGTALSGFGFFCDLKKLKEKKIPMPKHWSDLASPQFFGHIISADPTSSGSTYMIFDLIIQNLKWKNAWEIILSIAANVQGDFLKSSKIVFHKVMDSKTAICGLTIDYLFYLQKSELSPDVQKNLKFILPEETSIFTPDPIALCNKAKHPKLANYFIDYILSEGQYLLIRPVGYPKGPIKRSVPRLPVNKSIYKVKKPVEFYINPFNSVKAIKYDTKLSQRQKSVFVLLLKSAIIESHNPLKKAMKRFLKKNIVSSNVFTKVMPINQKSFKEMCVSMKSANRLKWNRLRYRWIKYFHESYKKLYK